MHPRNKNKDRHNFDRLIEAVPELSNYTVLNTKGERSLDFFNPTAVKLFNTAILKTDYGIEHWDIPKNNLCPPVPGRADYILYLADLLAGFNKNKIPSGEAIRGLDIGVGANCIYPLLGHAEYGWSFTGADIHRASLDHAQEIIKQNKLAHSIDLQHQANPQNVLKGLLDNEVYYDFSLCNPPFHSSAQEAELRANRKVKNLKGKRVKNVVLNFGGRSNELFRDGGEKQFILDYIRDSTLYPNRCFVYTCLLSKKSNVEVALHRLNETKARFVKVFPMEQGNKQSRFIAWSFLNDKQRKVWIDSRW